MAEGGGGEEDLSNPFSFKSYVKKKTKQQVEQDIDTDDIFGITGGTTSRKKEKQFLVVADDEENKKDAASLSSKPKKKGNKENPFSFKKFLGGQSGPRDGVRQEQATPQPTGSISDNGQPSADNASLESAADDDNAFPSPLRSSRGNHSAGLPPDFASDLPDFIQNHFNGAQARPDASQPLPDFAVPSDGRLDQLGSAQAGREGSAANIFSQEREHGVRGQSLSLPDFLVDSAVSGGQGEAGAERLHTPTGPLAGPRGADSLSGADPPNAVRLGAINGGSLPLDQNQITRLEEENQQLRSTIAQMSQRSSDEETRVAGLERELVRLRRKEAEETAVMERAVQQVETTLVATTTRAVQAESQVSKLRQEVKGLQAQLKTLTAENASLLSGDKGLSDLRERTKYASEQLTSSAMTAENNLKELLGGVEKLKLLGHVLASLEKVSDADSSPSEDTSPS